MNKLILHPTDMSQWHALVNEAQSSVKLALDEEMESYLVFLLMRFAQSTKLIESVLALDLLESMHILGNRQVDLLREVGDKSLLYCGLFPGMAVKRHVRLEYFSDLGQAAYLTVGELQLNESANLYLQLSAQFISMQQILQAMRGDHFHFNDMDRGIIGAKDLILQ